MSENLTIGTLAKRGGVNVETIRYYQRRGLLKEPAKPREGFRHYSPDTVKRVRFIKRAQLSASRWKRLLACSLLMKGKPVWRRAKSQLTSWN